VCSLAHKPTLKSVDVWIPHTYTNIPHNPSGLLVHLQRQYNPTGPPALSQECIYNPTSLGHPACSQGCNHNPTGLPRCALTGTHLHSHGAPCVFTQIHPHSKTQHKSLFLNLIHHPKCAPLHSIPSHQVPDNSLTHPCVS